MTPRQLATLRDFGPFDLVGDTIRDVNGMGMWRIDLQPPVMGIDRAIVAALNVACMREPVSTDALAAEIVMLRGALIEVQELASNRDAPVFLSIVAVATEALR